MNNRCPVEEVIVSSLIDMSKKFANKFLVFSDELYH
jgi:hypothetical protein